MTPEERKLVIDLFDRLATLEDAPRDPDAERLIRDGLQQAPNAVYALVQTALVQDEALKRANTRIQELESELDGNAPETAPRDTSFLGSMRDTLLGRREGRGSVPSVRPGESGSSQPSGAGMSPAWRNTGAPAEPAPGYGPPPGYGAGYGSGPQPGGSFLGTAAASAAGVIGGSLLMSGIRNLMGHSGSAHAAFNPAAGSSPSGGGNAGSAADSDLARDAGINDIGRTHTASADDAGRSESGYGLVDDHHGGDGGTDDGGNHEEADDDDFDDDGSDYDDNGSDV